MSTIYLLSIIPHKLEITNLSPPTFQDDYFKLGCLFHTKIDSIEESKLMLELAKEGKFIANKTDVILEKVPATKRMFGYDTGKLPGKKIENLIPPKYEIKNSQQ